MLERAGTGQGKSLACRRVWCTNENRGRGEAEDVSALRRGQTDGNDEVRDVTGGASLCTTSAIWVERLPIIHDWCDATVERNLPSGDFPYQTTLGNPSSLVQNSHQHLHLFRHTLSEVLPESSMHNGHPQAYLFTRHIVPSAISMVWYLHTPFRHGIEFPSCVYVSNVGTIFTAIWTTPSCSQRFCFAPTCPFTQSLWFQSLTTAFICSFLVPFRDVSRIVPVDSAGLHASPLFTQSHV